MAPLEVLHLPHDIPVAPLNRVGYAPSNTRQTALQPPFLDRCERSDCPLRGELIPQLMTASDGLHGAARIARAKASVSGTTEYGYLFRLDIHARVAMPSPSMAAWLRAQAGSEVWDALRPFAEVGYFDGILFPNGLILFERARESGALKEEYIWCVKSAGMSPADRNKA